MDDTPLYSVRITRNYIEYLREYYPDVDPADLLKYAGITEYQFEDEGHWISQQQVDRFHERLLEKTGNRDLAREVGRHFTNSKASGAVAQYALGFLTPGNAYGRLENLFYRVSRASTMTVTSLGRNKVEVVVTPLAGVTEKHFQCENRIGTFESIAKLFTNKLASVDHSECVHNGGQRCVYIVSWEEPRSVLVRRIRNYGVLASLFASCLFFFFLPAMAWVTMILSLALAVSGISLFAEVSAVRESQAYLRNHGTTARDLLDQISSSYDNIILIQEIGRITSNIREVKPLIIHICDALKRYSTFDRGLIMLANHDKSRLLYSHGYGYNHQVETFLEDTSFDLDNPDAKGEFVVSFNEKKPFLVNDIKAIETYVSKKTRQFIKKLETKSFICVPIIYEGQPEGIIAVDNLRLERPFNQRDVSLIEGIANQIGIGINNARFYQKTRESEEKFRALGENAPDIVYTLDATGRFTYINPAWERRLGHRKEEILGCHFTDFIKREDAGHFNRFLTRVREAGKVIRDVKVRILAKDGTERVFTMSGSPNKDSEQNVDVLIGTLKDVTELEKDYDALQGAMEGTINAMSSVVESRDPYTAGHQRRVANLANAIAVEMGLSDEAIKGIHMASMIHDIGKMYVPAEILTKPGKLSDLEFDMMKTHPEVGYNILKNIDFGLPVAQIVYQHHERIDGSGYPRGIADDNILMEAKIISVADVVEAMASHRPYRAALGIEKALEEISQNRDVLYDREVVDSCLRVFRDCDFSF